jgi:hypothetical protein
MSRSGYSDDGCEDEWANIRWRGAVNAALKGKRGQAFLKEMLAHLDAMPEKRLIAHEWVKDGDACALGVVARARGLTAAISAFDPADDVGVMYAARLLGIAPAMAREIVWMNDEAYWNTPTPETRWRLCRDWVAGQIKKEPPDAA